VDICLERGADCLHMVQLMPLPSKKTPSSLASIKSRLVLPFWYRLTQVVVDNVNVNVNVEFKVTLHERVRYRDTLQY